MPSNQQSLKFVYNPPMYVRIVGRAAERSLHAHDTIRGEEGLQVPADERGVVACVVSEV